jgi:hypothetical protein
LNAQSHVWHRRQAVDIINVFVSMKLKILKCSVNGFKKGVGMA